MHLGDCVLAVSEQESNLHKVLSVRNTFKKQMQSHGCLTFVWSFSWWTSLLKNCFSSENFFFGGGTVLVSFYWKILHGQCSPCIHVQIHPLCIICFTWTWSTEGSLKFYFWFLLPIHSFIHPSIYLYFQTHVKAISGADLTVLEVSRSSFIYLNDWELGACLSFSWSRIRFSIFSIITWWYFPVPPLKLSNGGHGSMAWWIFNKMPFYGHGVVAHGSRYFHGG